MRKIIQITSASTGTSNDLRIIALCDDGTVWKLDTWQASWEQVVGVPQAVLPTGRIGL